MKEKQKVEEQDESKSKKQLNHMNKEEKLEQVDVYSNTQGGPNVKS